MAVHFVTINKLYRRLSIYNTAMGVKKDVFTEASVVEHTTKHSLQNKGLFCQAKYITQENENQFFC